MITPDQPIIDPITVTTKEAERLLSIGHTTLYRLIDAGKIDTLTVGAKRLVTYASIKRFVVENAVAGKVAAK